MRLLTVADGFGDSKAVPFWYPHYIKWPEIIELLTRGVTLTNCSRYGAGNEYIIACAKNYFDKNDIVILQWACPNRFDLVLDSTNNFWLDEIAKDPVYYNNIVSVGSDTMWLSSGSTIPDVQQYHAKFISLKQHQLRSQLFVEYAKLLFNQVNIEFRFMLTENSQYLNGTDESNWLWHQPWHGLHDFRYHSKYADLDLGLVQPIPLIFFDFVISHIMPCVTLPWRNKTQIDAVENLLYKKYKQALEQKPNDSTP